MPLSLHQDIALHLFVFSERSAGNTNLYARWVKHVSFPTRTVWVGGMFVHDDDREVRQGRSIGRAARQGGKVCKGSYRGIESWRKQRERS